MNKKNNMFHRLYGSREFINKYKFLLSSSRHISPHSCPCPVNDSAAIAALLSHSTLPH